MANKSFQFGTSVSPSDGLELPNDIDIALAAGAATDEMEVTITVKDKDGNPIAAVHNLEFWFSESAAGIGLTGDSYSGALTAKTGAILTALTAKKHAIVTTAATGIAKLSIVDSANPVDQYACVKSPVTGRIHVSAASAGNWEGV